MIEAAVLPFFQACQTGFRKKFVKNISKISLTRIIEGLICAESE
jgi:hypothetical protein